MAKRRAKRKILKSENYAYSYDDKLSDSGILGMGKNIPPSLGFVEIYFLQQEMLVADAEQFFNHYEMLNWETVTGKPHRSWKVLAKDWIYNTLQEAKLLERRSAKRKAFPDA